MTRSRRNSELALGTLGLVSVFVVWQAVAMSGLVSRAFLPSVPATAEALVSGISRGSLLPDLAATTMRMIEGWLVSGLIGVAIGACLGLSRGLRRYCLPTLEFLRPLPAPAIVPLMISLLGLGPRMVLVVVVFGSLWPPLLATLAGFSLVEPRLDEVSRLLGLTRMQFIWKIGLPSALPDIIAGMRVSLALALILSVLGEMLAGQVGLGEAVLLAARSFRSPDLFAGITLLSGLGVAANVLLVAVEVRLRPGYGTGSRAVSA